MSTTDQVVQLFADRLAAAEDKQAAGEWVSRQINRMKHKDGNRPISFEEKTKIVELVGIRVTDQARSEGVDSAPLAGAINYILQNLDEDESDGLPRTRAA